MPFYGRKFINFIFIGSEIRLALHSSVSPSFRDATQLVHVKVLMSTTVEVPVLWDVTYQRFREPQCFLLRGVPT